MNAGKKNRTGKKNKQDAIRIRSQNVTLPPDAILATNAPGEGWTIVASVNSTPILATREKPSRQVWVGFWSASWARRVDFVIFWTNTFNWLGGQQSRFISEPTHALPAGWEPISPTTSPPPAAPSPTAPAPGKKKRRKRGEEKGSGINNLQC